MKTFGYQKPELLHQKRARERKERTRTKRVWSLTRPKTPPQDSVFHEAMDVVERAFKGKTMWQRADSTGLSVSTLSNHRQLKTKFPRLISVQMQLKAIGYELTIAKINRD